MIELDGALIAFDLRQSSVLGTLVQCGATVVGAYSFFMLAQRRVDYAHVEPDLGRVRDLLKCLERLVELIVVVVLESLDPCFDFLCAIKVLCKPSELSIFACLRHIHIHPLGQWGSVLHSPVLATFCWLCLLKGGCCKSLSTKPVSCGPRRTGYDVWTKSRCSWWQRAAKRRGS